MPKDTQNGMSGFKSFRMRSEEDYKKIVKIVRNLLKAMFPSCRVTSKEDDEGFSHIDIESDGRAVVFPIYNGYMEIGGTNYPLDSSGCVAVVEALSYFLDVPIAKGGKRLVIEL